MGSNLPLKREGNYEGEHSFGKYYEVSSRHLAITNKYDIKLVPLLAELDGNTRLTKLYLLIRLFSIKLVSHRC